IPALLRLEVGAGELQSLDSVLRTVRIERIYLDDAQVLEAGQYFLGAAAPTDHHHLVHRGDHGRTFSRTAATARSLLFLALSRNSSAPSRALRTMASRASSASLAAAAMSRLAAASARALASSTSLAASAVA